MSTTTSERLVLLDEELLGWVLRDATLEDVEHFFVYHADLHAQIYLEECPIG